MSNKFDLRYQKTHKLLQNSLICLLGDKPFHKIRVKDITECAQVNRNTFYLHYNDIHMLLNEILILGVTLDKGAPSKDEIFHNPGKLISRSMKYLYFAFRYPDLYSMVLQNFQTSPYFKEFYDCLLKVECGYQNILFKDKPSEYQPDIEMAGYVLAGQAYLISKWLKKETFDLEQLAIIHTSMQIKIHCSYFDIAIPEWVNSYNLPTYNSPNSQGSV